MEVFIDIIINLSEICDEEQLPIADEVWGFEVKRNEWVIAMLQIYERLYRKDLLAAVEERKLEVVEEANLAMLPKKDRLKIQLA